MFPVPAYNSNQYAFAYSTGSGTFLTSAEMQFVISNTLSRHFSGTNGVYIDSLLSNISNYTNGIRTTLTNSTNPILSSIDSTLSDIHDINWVSSSISPVWVLDHNNQVKSTSFTDTSISVVFNNFSSYFDDIPALFKIYVPIMDSRINVTVSNISSVLAGYFDSSDNSISYVSNQLDYFVEPCTRGVNIYLFGFRPHNVSYIAFTFNGSCRFIL